MKLIRVSGTLFVIVLYIFISIVRPYSFSKFIFEDTLCLVFMLMELGFIVELGGGDDEGGLGEPVVSAGSPVNLQFSISGQIG